MRRIELQFRGYRATNYSLPVDHSPFERIKSAEEANEILENALMSDEADEAADGWIIGEAAGEEFQIREVE